MTDRICNRRIGKFFCHRRYWAIPLTVWSLVVAASLLWNVETVQRHSEDIALQQARFVSQMIETFRLWNAGHGGVYVHADEDTPPNPYLSVPLRDFEGPDGRLLTLVNPAYMTRKVADLIGDEDGFSVRLTSNRPLNPINEPLKWEQRALQTAYAGASEYYAIEPVEGRPQFRYMLPLQVREACLQCHGDQGYRIGDIRGGLTVAFDYTPFQAAQASPMGHVVAVHLAVWLMLALLTVFGLSRYREQLLLIQDIRDRQEETIAERTAELREEIQERQQRETELRTLRRALQHSPASVVVTDTDSRIVFVNDKFTEVTGYREDEVLGQNPRLMQSGETPPDTYEEMYAALTEGREWHGEFVNRKKNGDLFFEDVSVSPVCDASGHISHFVAVKEDITERKHREGEIWRQAHYDALTGLANRTLFRELLGRNIDRARQAGQFLAVLYVDLDGFKPINDTLGHDAGDILLREVGQRLRETIRDSDSAARLGGDEFALLIAGLTRLEGVDRVAEKVLESVGRPYTLDDREVRISASVGVAVYPRDGDDGAALLQQADAAMYRAKRSGKNRHRHAHAPDAHDDDPA